MENQEGKKPKMGRPAKEKEKLDHSINVKLTEADFKSVRGKAKKIGMKTTRYAREMILKGRVRSRFTVEELALTRKLSGMANNLNQIARKANIDGFKEAEFIAYNLFVKLRALLYDSKK